MSARFPADGRVLTDEQRKDLDETRRLLLSLLLRPSGTKPSVEMLGTVANAVVFHSGLSTRDDLSTWISAPDLLMDALPNFLNQVIDRLDAGRWPIGPRTD